MTATRISTICTIGVTLGLAFSASIMAMSSSFAYSARAQQMCTGDAMRLCSSEIPSIPRITSCIRRNKSSLSPGCRTVLEKEDGGTSRNKVATTRS